MMHEECEIAREEVREKVAQARVELGRRIRAAREAAGLSQDAVAKELGVDQSTVAWWETGKASPRPRNRHKLHLLLGTPEATLALQVCTLCGNNHRQELDDLEGLEAAGLARRVPLEDARALAEKLRDGLDGREFEVDLPGFSVGE